MSAQKIEDTLREYKPLALVILAVLIVLLVMTGNGARPDL